MFAEGGKVVVVIVVPYPLLLALPWQWIERVELQHLAGHVDTHQNVVE